MKTKIGAMVIATILCLLVVASFIASSAGAQAPGEVLIYYGNGGIDPSEYGTVATYNDLKARYDGQGYATTYTDAWPADLSPFCLIILVTPGADDDTGTYYFTTSQVNALKSFMMAGGRLVVLGDWGGHWGINTVNDLLNKLGVGITQNADVYLSGFDSTPTTDITSDQITADMSSMQFADSSSLTLSGDAISLVREPGGATLIAVDQIAGAPPRPCADVVVSGDSQIMDDAWFDDGDGDNLTFIDNLVLCCAAPAPTPTPPPVPVGGYIVPVSKFELLAPYVGLAALMAVAVAAVVTSSLASRR